MKQTHIYCPTCDCYFKEPCRHIVEVRDTLIHGHHVHISKNTGKITIIKKNTGKFKKLLHGSKEHTAICHGIKRSENSDMEEEQIFFRETNRIKDIGIEAHREDHISWDRFGPQGIKKAHIAVTMHKQNALLNCDGMLNLYSKEIKLPKGVELPELKKTQVRVYKAIWVKEGQSYYTKYTNVSGWIAQIGEVFYHSEKSDELAVRGVLRKRRIAIEIARDAKRAKIKAAKFKERIPEKLKLCYADSLAAGNCTGGTDAFIRKHNLSKNKKYKATFLYDLEPRNENLRKVILYAMRQQNQLCKTKTQTAYGIYRFTRG